MGSFIVNQRTKDAMFNATHLVKQWNSIKGNPKRDLSKFFESKKVQEFIDELHKDEEFLHTPKVGYVKSKASRGKNAGTWMHPYLFIKLAMWINPKFELHVIKFVYDQLIELRLEAGDQYKGFSKAISTLNPTPKDYSTIAKGLNYIVFGEHETGKRNMGSLDQLKELVDLQKNLAYAIDMRFINSIEELLRHMRQMYAKQAA